MNSGPAIEAAKERGETGGGHEGAKGEGFILCKLLDYGEHRKDGIDFDACRCPCGPFFMS